MNVPTKQVGKYNGKLGNDYPLFECPYCLILVSLSCLVEYAEGRYADYQCRQCNRLLNVPLDPNDVLMLSEPFFFNDKGHIAMRQDG